MDHKCFILSHPKIELSPSTLCNEVIVCLREAASPQPVLMPPSAVGRDEGPFGADFPTVTLALAIFGELRILVFSFSSHSFPQL